VDGGDLEKWVNGIFILSFERSGNPSVGSWEVSTFSYDLEL
jgi:hypothetical protein